MILTAEQHWCCPNCPATAVTVGQSNRLHDCPGLAGLIAPLVLNGTRCRVRAVEREDYVGDADVRRDGRGRPMAAVVTERADGSNDVLTFPATVHMRIEV